MHTLQEQTSLFSKVRKKKVRNLFVGKITQEMEEDEEGIVNATKRSDYEASQVAANLMERAPEEASMKSLEATNSLVATALMMVNPNTTAPTKIIKKEKDMIASTLARMQHSDNKWAALGDRKNGAQDISLFDNQIQKQKDVIENEARGEDIEESSGKVSGNKKRGALFSKSFELIDEEDQEETIESDDLSEDFNESIDRAVRKLSKDTSSMRVKKSSIGFTEKNEGKQQKKPYSLDDLLDDFLADIDKSESSAPASKESKQ